MDSLKDAATISSSTKAMIILAAHNSRYDDVCGTNSEENGINHQRGEYGGNRLAGIDPPIIRLDCRKLNRRPNVPQKLSSNTAVIGPDMRV